MPSISSFMVMTCSIAAHRRMMRYSVRSLPHLKQGTQMALLNQELHRVQRLRLDLCLRCCRHAQQQKESHNGTPEPGPRPQRLALGLPMSIATMQHGAWPRRQLRATLGERRGAGAVSPGDPWIGAAEPEQSQISGRWPTQSARNNPLSTAWEQATSGYAHAVSDQIGARGIPSTARLPRSRR
jgi:hypothetical protein